MWEAINNFLVAVDDKVWGVPLMVLIIAGGVLLTSRLGFLQVRRLPLAEISLLRYGSYKLYFS